MGGYSGNKAGSFLWCYLKKTVEAALAAGIVEIL
jgi:hypothetical protein